MCLNFFLIVCKINLYEVVCMNFFPLFKESLNVKNLRSLGVQ